MPFLLPNQQHQSTEGPTEGVNTSSLDFNFLETNALPGFSVKELKATGC